MFLALVPAYNEDVMIGSVVRNLFSQVDEVVVIDDGSTDATAAVAAENGATVISHRLNRGQGAALETGHEYARRRGADIVLHFDGDGQFDVADIAPAVAAMKKKSVDILFGSRFLDDRSDLPWFKRHVLLSAAKLFQRFTLGVQLTDAHNGFRILNRRALTAIRLEQDQMAHATEILAAVKTAQLAFIEFPVHVVYREYGQGLAGGLAVLRDLLLGRFVKS